MPPKIITEIAILDRPEKRSGTQRVVEPFPFYDDPTRRRLSTQGKYLRVFDRGRLASGSDNPFFFAQNTFLNSPVYNSSINSFWEAGNGGVSYIFNSVDYTHEWNEYLLAEDPEGWPTLFREITQDLAAEYAMDVEPIAGFTPGRGLAIPDEITGLKGPAASTNALRWTLRSGSVSTQPYFPVWLDKDFSASSPSMKITKLPSFASPPETLTIDASIDLFIAPQIYTANGEARDYPLASTVDPFVPQTWYIAGIGVRTAPRSLIGDPDWDTVWANRSDIHGLPTALQEGYLLDLFVNNGNTPMWTAVKTTFTGPGSEPVTSLTEGLAGLPTEAAGSQNRISIAPAPYLTGSLMAAVRKHLGGGEFEWYYIWANAAWINLNNFPVTNVRV